MRILLATDGSEGALAAARFVRGWAGRASTVDLLYVVHDAAEYFPMMTAPFDVAAWREGMERSAADVFTRTRAELAPLCPHRELWRHGRPPGVIAELMEPYDLVVVGKRRKGSLSRLVLGSVSAQLAHSLEKPLLIV